MELDNTKFLEKLTGNMDYIMGSGQRKPAFTALVNDFQTFQENMMCKDYQYIRVMSLNGRLLSWLSCLWAE